MHSPFGGDEGDAEQEDEEDLDVEEGGDRRPLQTHHDSWTRHRTNFNPLDSRSEQL